MGDTSFSVQISTDLVNKLVNDDEQLKKRAKRRKPKPSRETNTPQKLQNKVKEKQISDDSKILTRPPAAGWPIQPPLFVPPPPPSHPTTYPELESIQSVLRDSEKVLEKLKKEEGHMTEEITQRAKDLHAKEYKLPEKKPMPCSEIWDAVSKCYKEHQVDTLKCASFVTVYEDCARQHRQEVNSSSLK